MGAMRWENKTEDSQIAAETWWTLVHPHAVMLERYITTEPTEKSDTDIQVCCNDLEQIKRQLEAIPVRGQSATMHDYLLRATTYLLHAYEACKREDVHETQFYYYNALTDLSKLHHQLVTHGLVGN